MASQSDPIRVFVVEKYSYDVTNMPHMVGYTIHKTLEQAQRRLASSAKQAKPLAYSLGQMELSIFNENSLHSTYRIIPYSVQ